MKVLENFAIRNLVLNKKRSILTIIGIILSTALIVSISTLGTSFYQTMIELQINNVGSYHSIYTAVPNEGIKYIVENINVEESFKINNLGYAKLEGSKNESKPYVYIKEFDDVAFNNIAVNLIEGRMPENSNEIVVPENIISNGRVIYNVGDKVSFEVGTRQTLDGQILNQSVSYMTEIDKKEAQEFGIEIIEEEIVNTSNKEYTIVGIVERMPYQIETFSAPGYVIISKMDNEDINSNNIDVGVIYKETKEAYEVEDDIKEVLENETGKEIYTEVNGDLISYQGGGNSAITNSLYTVIGIVIAIIIGTSVFVIRNSFNISISEKLRQYGMLKSIGATKKQIRKTIILEGTYLGSVAIPIGIMSGIIATYVLVQVVNTLLGDTIISMKMAFNVPLVAVLGASILAGITIYLSALIPSIKAARISSIELIRGNDDIKIKSKKLKTSKLTKKIFGIGGVIASKNLKRSKKKYRTTVISIVVSIFIFISISTFFEIGTKVSTELYDTVKYNIRVDLTNDISIDTRTEIKNMEYVDTFSYWGKVNVEYSPETLTQQGISETENYKKMYEENTNEEYKYETSIAVINKEEFKRYVEELGLNPEEYQNISIISDQIKNIDENGKYSYFNMFNITDGDKIGLKINGNKIDLEIDKRTTIHPMGMETSYNDAGWIFISEDNYEIGKYIEEDDIRAMDIYTIYSSQPDKLEADLVEKIDRNENYQGIQVYNIEKERVASKNLMLVMGIFLYGFITVISLIGVTNILNTITTNMNLRSKEFANLKSIGMTKKEFNKMIRLESLMYGLKSLIIGVPLGLVGSYMMYLGSSSGMDYGYNMPIPAIIISIAFVFIIITITMKYSISKINKQNIIETIRKDNI